MEANRKALGVLCAAASRLSSVDASLHEVARVDGATPLQRIFYIDIPELVPVIVIQLIMSFGNLMNVGFEKAYLLQTSLNKATSEIIATYVYEQGLLKAMYSFSTASIALLISGYLVYSDSKLISILTGLCILPQSL